MNIFKMAQNEKNSKLKSKRFNKFEISESAIQTKNLNILSDVPHKSDKKIIDLQSTSSKKVSYNFIRPPCSTVNLANKRLQNLKQSLQNDLKNRKPFIEDNKNPKIKCVSKLDLQETDSCISKKSTKSSNCFNTVSNNSAQRRINRVKKRISRSLRNLGSDESTISSCHVASPISLQCNSTFESSHSIAENHRSPLLEEKINCKRKFSESTPSPDESVAAKKFHYGPNLNNYSISQVKTDEINLRQSKLSARILKIKSKTDKINSSLTSPFETNCSNSSDQLHKHFFPSSSSNQDDSFQVSENGKKDNRFLFNNSDIINENTSSSKNCISQRLKVNQHIELNMAPNHIHEKNVFNRHNKPETMLQKQIDTHTFSKNVDSPNSTDVNGATTSLGLIINNEPTSENNTLNSCHVINVNKTLCQKTISDHNAPLLDGDDHFNDKMVMTASWIKNHHHYNPTYKIADGEELSSTINVDLENNSEEMEWTNAEPDIQDIPTIEKNESVEDNSGDVNSINCKIEKKVQCLCIVVDTNVFISDLSKINDIINLKVAGPLQPLVYIPWMVITELDEIKDRPGNNTLKQKVFNAIKCINKLLSEENPKVKGQTICDMGKQIHVGAAQDDKIIGTCLQAIEKYESVILLSNDVNLKNKALINNIAVSSAREVIMKIMSKLVKNTKYKKIKQKMGMICSSIICETAKEAYGDVWMKMDMLSNPPWSLEECLRRFQKYWTAVFQQKLMKQFLPTVNKLKQLLDDHTFYIADDSENYQLFMKLSLNLCIFLKDLEEYKGYIENTINDIINIG